jgi:hypothetical protein
VHWLVEESNVSQKRAASVFGAEVTHHHENLEPGMMSCVVTCTDMLQGIMTHPAFQSTHDSVTVKAYFHVWQVL